MVNFFVGLSLPKDVEENLRPTIKDAEGMKEVQLGLPSPFFGEQRKDNPKTKCKAQGVVVNPEKPIGIYLDRKRLLRS